MSTNMRIANRSRLDHTTDHERRTTQQPARLAIVFVARLTVLIRQVNFDSSSSCIPNAAWYGCRDSGTAGSHRSSTQRSRTCGNCTGPASKTAMAKPDLTRNPNTASSCFASLDLAFTHQSISSATALAGASGSRLSYSKLRSNCIDKRHVVTLCCWPTFS